MGLGVDVGPPLLSRSLSRCLKRLTGSYLASLSTCGLFATMIGPPKQAKQRSRCAPLLVHILSGDDNIS